MCITSREAMLHGTFIGAWDIELPKYGYRHVLAYQNAPQNLVDGANCMLLHIQADEAILPEHIVDTSKNIDFLKDGTISILQRQLSRGDMIGARTAVGPPKNYVTEMGVYHIAILNDVKDYKNVLNQIPENKRPIIDRKFIEFFDANFPDYPLLLCCFNNKEAANASPIMVHYKPKRPDILMLNMLDSHDGNVPTIGKPYFTHQKVLIGSYKADRETEDFKKVDWGEIDGTLKSYLPNYALAESFMMAELPNVDMLVKVKDLQETNEVIDADFAILPKFVDFE